MLRAFLHTFNGFCIKWKTLSKLIQNLLLCALSVKSAEFSQKGYMIKKPASSNITSGQYCTAKFCLLGKFTAELMSIQDIK